MNISNSDIPRLWVIKDGLFVNDELNLLGTSVTLENDVYGPLDSSYSIECIVLCSKNSTLGFDIHSDHGVKVDVQYNGIYAHFIINTKHSRVYFDSKNVPSEISELLEPITIKPSYS